MKKILFSTVLLLSLCFFSTDTFAQDEVPGGSSDGTGGTVDGGGTTVAVQPLAVHFIRNNGDGTCGGLAQIRLYYSIAPTIAPVLTQIYYEGQPLYSNFSPVKGDISKYSTTGYVNFCLNVSNIPPAIKLTLTYNPGGTNQAADEISGTD